MELPTLGRWRGDMIEVYNIMKNLHHKVAVPFKKLSTEMANRQACRGQSLEDFLKTANKLIQQKSFGIQVVTEWNNLPEYVICVLSLDSFKRR